MTPLRTRVSVLLTGLALVALSGTLAPVSAQQQEPPAADSAAETPARTAGPPMPAVATLEGRVVSDFTGKAVDGAVVQVKGAAFGAMTDSVGEFRIDRVPAGLDTVTVNYPGYEENRTTLELEPGKTTRVIFLLSPSAIRIAGIEVTVERRGDGIERGFERRRQRGVGTYIPYEEIREKNPRYTSDLLRDVPGVFVGSSQQGGIHPVVIRRAVQNCSPTVILDGIEMPRMEVDEVAPYDLRMIEIYTGPAQIPAQFRGMRENCGLVVMWTRQGDEERDESP